MELKSINLYLVKIKAAKAGKTVIDFTRDLSVDYPVMDKKRRKNGLPKF